jgi:hypothetical protein
MRIRTILFYALTSCFSLNCIAENRSDDYFIIKQNQFEERLNILYPLFDDEKNYNYLYHFSKGSPYYPYRFYLKQKPMEFSSYVIGFDYSFSKNKKVLYYKSQHAKYIKIMTKRHLI